MSRDEKLLTKALYVRVAEEDIVRLEALVERIPIASRNAIARAAMRLGMALLEDDPTRIIGSPPPKRGRKPGRYRS